MHETTAFLCLFVALVGPPAVAILARGLSLRIGDLAAGLISQFLLIMIAGLILTEHLLIGRRSLAAIGLKSPTVGTFVIAIVVAATFVAVIGPMLLRIPNWLSLPGFECGLADLAKLPIWYLVLAIVVGGVVEELLYRGYALVRLAEIIGSMGLALLLVNVAFGAAHAPLWGWGPAVTTMISGAAFSAIYLWHGDLIANIAAHIATDLAGILTGSVRSRANSKGDR